MKNNKKELILNAWMMMEYLSEGDLDAKDISQMQKLDEAVGGDYAQLLKDEAELREMTNRLDKVKCKNYGYAVYFDIFELEEMRAFLREQVRIGTA